MFSPPGIFGVIFVWLGSTSFCYEYLNRMWPSTMFIILPAIGVPFILYAAYRHEDGRTILAAVAAIIPPLTALASQGFVI